MRFRFLILACLFGWPALGHAHDTELRWQFKPEESFQLETTTELTQTVKIKNQQGDLTQNVKHVLLATYRVKQANQDGYVLEQRIDSIKTESPVGAAPPSKLFQQLEGATLLITLNDKFQLIKLEGYDEMIKKVAGDDANVVKVVTALLPKETLIKSLEESFSFLPPAGHKAGEPWERKFDAALGPLGTLSITNVYQMMDNETVDGRNLARISVKPKITYAKPTDRTGDLPIQITDGQLNLESASGTLWFDSAAGKLVKSDMALKLKGALTVQTSGQQDEIELVQEQTVKIRLVEPAK
ncbi:MAG TPA: DUF6263 family protein [Gemmatales bacterium]|nr:DUF6263 family protein [Gemmatales bacterium]HMP59624.1 DUF6263 family protein [Gemmatales bacterium]